MKAICGNAGLGFAKRCVAVHSKAMVILTMTILCAGAHAHESDLFWYYYPSPMGYLYVDDPVRYRSWSAQYVENQVTVPGENLNFPFTETIYFAFNSCEVGGEHFKTLQGIAELIADNEAIAVLGGHTDVRGEADVNVRYGYCRVQSVVDLLEAFGIPDK